MCSYVKVSVKHTFLLSSISCSNMALKTGDLAVNQRRKNNISMSVVSQGILNQTAAMPKARSQGVKESIPAVCTARRAEVREGWRGPQDYNQVLQG
jgi:hypothetical protein